MIENLCGRLPSCLQLPLIRTSSTKHSTFGEEKKSNRALEIFYQFGVSLYWQQEISGHLCGASSEVTREPSPISTGALRSGRSGPCTLQSSTRCLIRRHPTHPKYFKLFIPVHYWNLPVSYKHTILVIVPFLCNFREHLTDKIDSPTMRP